MMGLSAGGGRLNAQFDSRRSVDEALNEPCVGNEQLLTEAPFTLKISSQVCSTQTLTCADTCGCAHMVPLQRPITGFCLMGNQKKKKKFINQSFSFFLIICCYYAYSVLVKNIMILGLNAEHGQYVNMAQTKAEVWREIKENTSCFSVFLAKFQKIQIEASFRYELDQSLSLFLNLKMTALYAYICGV